LPTPHGADYAVRQEAAWKKDVWHTASALPRRATPRHYGMPSARPWRIPITRAAAKATAAPPAGVTSWCWSALIARIKSGRWLVSSNAICGSTTICRSTTSAPRATRHRLASFDICSIRPSTRSGRSNRKSRSAATRPPGSTSFATFRASISKARNIVDPTTGPSGAGIGNRHAKTNAARSSLLPDLGSQRHGHPGHPRRRRRAAPMVHCNPAFDLPVQHHVAHCHPVRTAPPSAAHALTAPVALVAQVVVLLDHPTRAEVFSRSILRGGC